MNLQDKINYFTQLTMLIKSGMRLPEALFLLAHQTAHAGFGWATSGVAHQVNNGIFLSQALSQFPQFFGPIMIQMIRVGQESGNIIGALTVLCKHLESVAAFKKKLRGALLLPLVTAGFFVLVTAIILVVVVPQLTAVFGSLNKELPASTKLLMGISNFIKSWRMIVLGLGGLAVYYGLTLYAKTASGKSKIDMFVLRSPFVAAVYTANTMATFFKSLALLLEGGTSLVQACNIVKESVANDHIRRQLQEAFDHVKAGNTIAHALKESTTLCDQETIALLQVAQETGMLIEIVTRIAHAYEERLLKNLTRANALFGPCLLVFLGLMIGSLIVAIYTPIMNVAFII
jgi:type IV pilus assembly protein PilC